MIGIKREINLIFFKKMNIILILIWRLFIIAKLINETQIILEMKARGWTRLTIKNYLYHISKFLNSNKKAKEYLFSILSSNKSESYS
jgi:hypothetical protein